ncbi:MAG: ferritin-like domain-containing protein [Caulobacteraceae bacterium]
MTALLARIVNPVVWRIPGHGARKLYSFSLAEHGSMLDLKAAARLTASPERQTLYIRHMLDETRHAQMFALRSAELRAEEGAQSFGFPKADYENLFERLGELRFLAFVHRGEKRGRAQFETYRNWFARRDDNKTRALFDAIVRDEKRHETYTRDILVEMAGSEAAARRELARAAMWEAWRNWRRFGRFGAEKAYFAVMTALYAMLAPFMVVAAFARPARTGWTPPSDEATSGARPIR